MANPHNYLTRLAPKGEIGPWRCENCGVEGPLEELRAETCDVPIDAALAETNILDAVKGDTDDHD